MINAYRFFLVQKEIKHIPVGFKLFKLILKELRNQLDQGSEHGDESDDEVKIFNFSCCTVFTLLYR